MAGATLVIVNPSASKLRDSGRRVALSRALRAELQRRDGIEPKIVETASRDDARPAVEAALTGGVSAVVGVGGDGTLRDIAAVLRDTDVPLGVVPAGTGNLFAAQLRIPASPERAVGALGHAVARRIDLGEVTYRRVDGAAATSIFTIGCGAGLDARIMAATPGGWKRRLGPFAYLLQGARLALDVRVAPYRISVDGRVIETEASIAMIANMGQLIPGYLGPRLPVDPADGLLDLIVAAAPNPFKGGQALLDQLLRSSLGGESGSDSIRLRGRSFTIETDPPEPMQVDGDYVGDGELEARVLPSAIGVLVPTD